MKKKKINFIIAAVQLTLMNVLCVFRRCFHKARLSWDRRINEYMKSEIKRKTSRNDNKQPPTLSTGETKTDDSSDEEWAQKKTRSKLKEHLPAGGNWCL